MNEIKPPCPNCGHWHEAPPCRNSETINANLHQLLAHQDTQISRLRRERDALLAAARTVIEFERYLNDLAWRKPVLGERMEALRAAVAACEDGTP